jgi:hypothetical protein
MHCTCEQSGGLKPTPRKSGAALFGGLIKELGVKPQLPRQFKQCYSAVSITPPLPLLLCFVLLDRASRLITKKFFVLFRSIQ